MVPLLQDMIVGGIETHARPAPARAAALDIGCGGQPFRALVEAMGYQYTGFDAQQNPAGTVDVIGAVDEPLPTLLLARGPFHFVLCTEVLEHVARWHIAFANIFRLLSPGGRVLITCPHFYPPHEEPYDFWRPTSHALEVCARDAGLRPLEIRRAGDAGDILGTLLAVTRFRAAGRRVGDHVVAVLAQALCRLALAGLRNPRLRRRLRVKGPLYLSNFAVFERPA